MSKSISLLNDMIELKEPIPKIFFTISKHLRNIYTVKSLDSQGVSPKDIASSTGIKSFIVSKLLKQGT